MKFLAFSVAAAAMLFAQYSYAAPPPEIRVLVIDQRPSITIEGAGSPISIVSKKASAERPTRSATIQADARGLASGGIDLGAEVAIEASSGRFRIEGGTFRGSLTVVWKGPGQLQVIDRLPLEDYLNGIINSEISSTWPEESIKAQAVAARTYALDQIERSKASRRPYDLTSTMFDQVYAGAHAEDAKSERAVAATRGEVLYRGGSIFKTYYHSCCGGRTENAGNVWTGERGPPVIADVYCARSPKLIWNYEIPAARLAEMLTAAGTPIGRIRTIAVTALADSPRVGELLVEDDEGLKIVKATDIRKIAGYQNVKSTWFEVKLAGTSVVFTGRGYGHGVGLCQWGAKGMAEDGAGYRDILKFYYPDAELSRAY